jgi:hypothetical protein
MGYTGRNTHPERRQEVPALFTDRRLSAFVHYSGSKPWTKDKLSYDFPSSKPGSSNPASMYAPTERWAAYVDPETGYGLGVYVPVSKQITAYRVGPDDSSSAADCSYMAPLVMLAIKPGTVFSYDVYLAVGRVDAIRNTFYSIQQHGR